MFDRLNTVQVRDRFDAQFEARGADTWYRQDGLGPAFEISADTRDDLQRRYHSRFRLAAMGFGAFILAPVIVRVLRGDTLLMHQSHLGPEGTGWALWIGLGLVGLMLTRTVLWRDPARRVKGLTPVAPPPLTEDSRDHAVLFSALFNLSSVRWTDPLITAVNRVCLLTGLANLLCGLFVASQRLRRERRA